MNPAIVLLAGLLPCTISASQGKPDSTASLASRVLQKKTRAAALAAAEFTDLVGLLQHDNPRVPPAVWYHLQRNARRLSGRLVDLRKKHPEHAIWTGLLLHGTGVPVADYPELWRKAIAHQDAVVRAAAAERPLRSAEDELLLLPLLEDADSRVRSTALRALSRNRRTLPASELPRVLRATRKKRLTMSAPPVLARFGKAALPAIRELLESDAPQEVRAATQTISRLRNLPESRSLLPSIVAAIDRHMRGRKAARDGGRRTQRWWQIDLGGLLYALAATGPDALPRLIRYSKHTDPIIANAAAKALGHADTDDDKIAGLLASPDKQSRAAGLRLARSRGNPMQWLPQILPMLGDDDAPVRDAAIAAISRAPSISLIPKLLETLYKTEPDKRNAIRLLLETCRNQPDVRSESIVLHGLRGKLAQERLVALRFFSRRLKPTSADLIEALIECSSNEHPYVRSFASSALRNVGTALRPQLVARLISSKRPEARRFALRLAPNLEVEARLPILIEALADPLLRSTALGQLRQLGPRAKSALPSIVAQLEGDRFPEAALRTLVAISPKDERVAERARSYVEDALTKTPGRLPTALPMLGSLGSAGADLVPLAVAKARGTPASRRSAFLTCFEGLGRFAAPAVPLLIDWMKHAASSADKTRIVMALRRIGPAAAPAIPPLLELAASSKPEGRWSVTALTGILPGCDAATAAPVLAFAERVAKDRGPNAAAVLWAALWPYSKRAVMALGSGDRGSKQAAVMTLQVLARRDAAAVLELVANLDGEQLVAATRALGSVREQKDEAVRLLTKQLGEPHAKTALAALIELGSDSAPAIAPVAERLASDETLAPAAARLFAIVGDAGIAALKVMLESESTAVRKAALQGLATSRTGTTPLVPRLLEIARSNDAPEATLAIRAMIASGRRGCMALSELGERLPLLASCLGPLLRHEDPVVQQKMWTLASRHPDLHRAALRMFVTPGSVLTGNTMTRKRVINFIGQLEYSSASAKRIDRFLLDGLSDPIADVRRRALLAVASSKAIGTLNLASLLVRDEDPVVRAQAAITVASFGAHAARYRSDLEAMNTDADKRVREAAAKALGRLQAGR